MPKKYLYMVIRARFQRAYSFVRKASTSCEVSQAGEDPSMREMTASVGSLVKAQMSLSLRREVSRYSSNAARSRPRNRPPAKPPPAKHDRIRECRLVGKIGSIHDAELLALLALFKGGCHGRFVHLLQQRVVELQSRVMVAGDLLILLPRPAGSTRSATRRCEPAARSEPVPAWWWPWTPAPREAEP